MSNNIPQKQQHQRQDRLGRHYRRDLVNMFELFFGPFTVEKACNRLPTDRNHQKQEKKNTIIEGQMTMLTNGFSPFRSRRYRC